MWRTFFPFLILAVLGIGLAGCAGDMKDKWPSLAPRAGEVPSGLPMPATGYCAGCGQDVVAGATVPPSPAALKPMPADTDARLASIAAVIAGVEAKVPAQARITMAVIAAVHRDPSRSGDAEVERSRYESLFLPLSIEDSRLVVLTDNVVGRNGADAVLAKVIDLRARLAALQQKRTSLPD